MDLQREVEMYKVCPLLGHSLAIAELSRSEGRSRDLLLGLCCELKVQGLRPSLIAFSGALTGSRIGSGTAGNAICTCIDARVAAGSLAYCAMALTPVCWKSDFSVGSYVSVLGGALFLKLKEHSVWIVQWLPNRPMLCVLFPGWSPSQLIKELLINSLSRM